MNTLNVLCFIGLISLGFAFSVRENVQELNSQLGTFDNKNVSVDIYTTYETQLNISELNKNRDPNSKYSLYLNVATNFTLPGQHGPRALFLNTQKLLNFDVYTNKDRWSSETKRDGWTLENGTVTINGSTGVSSEITGMLNFPNSSKISFNVYINRNVNITYPYKTGFKVDNKNLEILDDLEMPQVKSDDHVEGLLPLFNISLYDITYCQTWTCTSNSQEATLQNSFELLDGIKVQSNLDLKPDYNVQLSRSKGIQHVNVFANIVLAVDLDIGY